MSPEPTAAGWPAASSYFQLGGVKVQLRVTNILDTKLSVQMIVLMLSYVDMVLKRALKFALKFALKML